MVEIAHQPRMKIFTVRIIKSQLGLIYRYYENFFGIFLKIKIAHHLEKQSKIKNKTLILIINFDYS